jgi:transposase
VSDEQYCRTSAARRSSGPELWLFAGSERGGQRAAFMYSLIGSAKLNDVDPQAWLADVIAKISDMPKSRLSELLPWNLSRPAYGLTEVA